MHMAQTRRRWTLDQVHRLPEDGNKYELVHGELLVTPAPSVDHETIAVRLARILDRYVEANGLGYVFRPRAVFRVGSVVEVEPDLMVRQAPVPDTDWDDAPRPILVVEVASEATRRRDRVKKRAVYVDAGIPDYWIVNGESRTVCVVRPGVDDEIVSDTLAWHPEGPTEPLTFSLVGVFGPGRDIRQR